MQFRNDVPLLVVYVGMNLANTVVYIFNLQQRILEFIAVMNILEPKSNQQKKRKKVYFTSVRIFLQLKDELSLSLISTCQVGANSQYLQTTKTNLEV